MFSFVIDFVSQVSEMTTMSASVDLTQILTMSIFGTKLRTLRWIHLRPDINLKSAGVWIHCNSGPGFDCTSPDRSKSSTITTPHLTLHFEAVFSCVKARQCLSLRERVRLYKVKKRRSLGKSLGWSDYRFEAQTKSDCGCWKCPATLALVPL